MADTNHHVEPRADQDAQTDAILQFLADPASYPDPTTGVERIDTHISWVFLTDRFVYKMKKPVCFDFLDFSTLELRKAACQQELVLNRRLAEETYLRVVELNRSGEERLQLDGAGPPLEYLVKMNRLPASQALDRLIETGQLLPAQVDELTDKLIRFYSRQPTLRSIAESYPERIAEHVAGNSRDLGAFDALLDAQHLRRAITSQTQLLRIAPRLFVERALAGRLVDGHGDLRPEHVYFCPHPVVIDCIEFNDDLRHVDVLDELAFLAVECEHLTAEGVGQQIIGRYRERTGDAATPRLEAFYKSYRAVVRAKVCALRAQQVGAAEQEQLLGRARDYLRLAARHAAAVLPPLLLVVYGLSGTGKSTFAKRLADELQIDYLSTDLLRREMFGAQKMRAGRGEGHYTPQKRGEVYDEMFRRTDVLLQKGSSVVVDGTFTATDRRTAAVDLAQQNGAQPLLVHCHCPPRVALDRIARRLERGESESDATPEIYRHQAESFGADPPGVPVVDVNTTAQASDAVRTVLDALAGCVLA